MTGEIDPHVLVGDNDDRDALAHVAYALLSLPVAVGLGLAFAAGSFSLPWLAGTVVAGAVLARARLREDRQSWLDTHLRWQLRVFWRGLAAAAIVAALRGLLAASASARSFPGIDPYGDGLGVAMRLLILGHGVVAIAVFGALMRGWWQLARGVEMDC